MGIVILAIILHGVFMYMLISIVYDKLKEIHNTLKRRTR